MHRTYACTFPVQRKEIDVVKVRFTMKYSWRKLSNDKVITTACIFWRPIACSFQVMSGNILFLGNKIFEIPPFFQTRPGDLGKKVHACSLRFSALKIAPVKKFGRVRLSTNFPSKQIWRRMQKCGRSMSFCSVLGFPASKHQEKVFMNFFNRIFGHQEVWCLNSSWLTSLIVFRRLGKFSYL